MEEDTTSSAPVDKASVLNESFSFVKLDLSVVLQDKPLTNWTELKAVLVELLPGIDKYELSSLKNAISGLSLYTSKTSGNEWDFYKDLLPLLVQWATDHKQKANLPLLSSKKEGKITLTSHQLRYILANSFFLNTTSVSEILQERTLYGNISLAELYALPDHIGMQRLLCHLSYFAQAVDLPLYDVSYERYLLTDDQKPNWKNNDQVLSCDSVNVHDAGMECSDALGFADFANEFIHIGHIAPSTTQEEVLYSCCPECFPVMLWCELMYENEAVIIRGVRRFSNYTGYLGTFQWSGHYESLEGVPDHRDILVYDASMGAATQFVKPFIYRDLDKAFISFKGFAEGVDPEKRKITTGHWGCGAFGGEKTLKFLQQLCAATLTGVSMDYSTFKDVSMKNQLQDVLAMLKEHNVTVGRAYQLMVSYVRNSSSFYEFIKATLSQVS